MVAKFLTLRKLEEYLDNGDHRERERQCGESANSLPQAFQVGYPKTQTKLSSALPGGVLSRQKSQMWPLDMTMVEVSCATGGCFTETRGLLIVASIGSTSANSSKQNRLVWKWEKSKHVSAYCEQELICHESFPKMDWTWAGSSPTSELRGRHRHLLGSPWSDCLA